MNDFTDHNKGITVYCGSSEGANPNFAETAADLGGHIAKAGMPLYYGGGHMGLMGIIGRAVRANGGQAIAIIPEFMVDRGWNDPEASHTIITPSMHARKELMARLAVAAVALPGGIGTFEELCEIITWKQLGLFSGNIVILNINGYYDPWLSQMNKAVDEGFLPQSHLSLFCVASNPDDAIRMAIDTSHPQSISPKF